MKDVFDVLICFQAVIFGWGESNNSGDSKVLKMILIGNIDVIPEENPISEI
jgi:hypothetical protein